MIFKEHLDVLVSLVVAHVFHLIPLTHICPGNHQGLFNVGKFNPKGLWGESEPEHCILRYVIDVIRRTDYEPLEDGDEEEKQLLTGERLSQTGSSPW